LEETKLMDNRLIFRRRFNQIHRDCIDQECDVVDREVRGAVYRKVYRHICLSIIEMSFPPFVDMSKRNTNSNRNI